MEAHLPVVVDEVHPPPCPPFDVTPISVLLPPTSSTCDYESVPDEMDVTTAMMSPFEDPSYGEWKSGAR